MAFQVSPGVQVTEKDLTNVVPAVATSIARIVMAAEKGPTDTVTAISSEEAMVSIFGEPQSASNHFEDWMSAASFLGYGNALRVVRPSSGAVNACTSGTAILIKNGNHYKDGDGTTGPYNVTTAGPASVGQWAARTAGAWGNNLKIAMCPSAAVFEQLAGTVTNNKVASSAEAAGQTAISVVSDDGFNVGDIINFGEADGSEYKVTGISGDVLTIQRHGTANTAGGLRSEVAASTNIRRRWEYYDEFDAAPGTSTWVQDRTGVATADEMHIIVIDEDGGISGTPGEVLEKYEAVSKIADARTAEGAANFYVDVLYNSSSYIYCMDHPGVGTGYGNTATAQGTTLYSA